VKNRALLMQRDRSGRCFFRFPWGGNPPKASA
jgi:hypothetical protein